MHAGIIQTHAHIHADRHMWTHPHLRTYTVKIIVNHIKTPLGTVIRIVLCSFVNLSVSLILVKESLRRKTLHVFVFVQGAVTPKPILWCSLLWIKFTAISNISSVRSMP